MTPIVIDNAFIDGPKYLNDLRTLAQLWGVADTYCYSTQLLDFEMYIILVEETIYSAIYSLAGVIAVMLLITGSIRGTLLILFSALIVDLYLVALIPLWDLTFNNVIVVHLLASVALSVLYSLFIILDFMMARSPY